MNRNYGVRPTIYQGPPRTPHASPQRPKFAACDRLPPAPPPRRAWTDCFQDLFKVFCGIGIAILVIELVLQIILHDFLQAPVSRAKGLGLRTHYDTLQIKHDADQDAITTAWRQRERDHHSNIVGNNEVTRETYYWIQLAYAELSDPLARCYHDQYHGFLPRKFGKDDPCIQILTDLARRSRLNDQMYQRADGTEKFPLADIARDKVYEKWGQWQDAMAEKKQKLDAHGGLVEALQKLAKRIAAWPFIALGFFFGVLELLAEYIGELAERYEWRQRLFRSIYL